MHKDVQSLNKETLQQLEGCMLQSSLVDNIHQFWFGTHCHGTLPLEKIRLWFGEDPASVESDNAHAYVERHFLPQMTRASSGDLAEWQHDVRGSLALIVLLEQFPRLLSQSQTFAKDCRRYALKYCKAGLQADLDDVLNPAELCCFYAPLLNSHNFADRQHGIFLLEQLLAQTCSPDHPHQEQRDLVRRSLFAAIERNAAADKSKREPAMA